MLLSSLARLVAILPQARLADVGDRLGAVLRYRQRAEPAGDLLDIALDRAVGVGGDGEAAVGREAGCWAAGRSIHAHHASRRRTTGATSERAEHRPHPRLCIRSETSVRLSSSKCAKHAAIAATHDLPHDDLAADDLLGAFIKNDAFARAAAIVDRRFLRCIVGLVIRGQPAERSPPPQWAYAAAVPSLRTANTHATGPVVTLSRYWSSFSLLLRIRRTFDPQRLRRWFGHLRSSVLFAESWQPRRARP